MFDTHHVRVDVSLEPHGAKDLVQLGPVAEKFGWSIEDQDSRSASLIVAVEGSSKRSAWKKAQKLVEANTRHIIGLRVDLAIVRPFKFQLVNGYKIIERPKRPRKCNLLTKVTDSAIGTIYSKPSDLTKRSAENSESLKNRVNKYGWNNLLSRSRIDFKSSGGYIDSKDVKRIESQQSGTLLLVVVITQLSLCLVAGLGSGWFSRTEVSQNWKFAIVGMVAVAFFALAIITYRISREGFKVPEKIFFHFYPAGMGILTAAIFRDPPGSVLVMVLGGIAACVVVAFLWFGLTISLIYPNTKALIIQGPIFLGFFLGGFNLYANYRFTYFLEALNVPASSIEMPDEFVFEVSLKPSLAILVSGLLIVSVTGWHIYLNGAGDLSWNAIAYGAILYLLAIYGGLYLSVLILSGDASADAKKSMWHGDSSIEYFGIDIDKVCVYPKTDDPLVQFGDFDFSNPYWYFRGDESDIWLIGISEVDGTARSDQADLVSEPILVSATEVELRIVDEDVRECR